MGKHLPVCGVLHKKKQEHKETAGWIQWAEKAEVTTTLEKQWMGHKAVASCNINLAEMDAN